MSDCNDYFSCTSCPDDARCHPPVERNPGAVNPIWGRLLAMWLQQAANDLEARARPSQRRYERLANKSTQYARALRGIVEAHREAAEVYRRRLLAFAAETGAERVDAIERAIHEQDSPLRQVTQEHD